VSASAFTQQSFEATKSEVTDPDYAEAERFLKLLDPRKSPPDVRRACGRSVVKSINFIWPTK